MYLKKILLQKEHSKLCSMSLFLKADGRQSDNQTWKRQKKRDFSIHFA